MLAWPSSLGQVISSWADNNFNFSLSVTLMHASAARSSCRTSCFPLLPPWITSCRHQPNRTTHIAGWRCEINNWWLVVWGPLARTESLKSGLWSPAVLTHCQFITRPSDGFSLGFGLAQMPQVSGLTNVGKSLGKRSQSKIFTCDL